MAIVYTMLAKAFEPTVEDLHLIITLVLDRDVFLELDQLLDITTCQYINRGSMEPGLWAQ